MPPTTLGAPVCAPCTVNDVVYNRAQCSEQLRPLWLTRGGGRVDNHRAQRAAEAQQVMPAHKQYVGKSQSCMVIIGRLIVHAPVATLGVASAACVPSVYVISLSKFSDLKPPSVIRYIDNILYLTSYGSVTSSYTTAP